MADTFTRKARTRKLVYTVLILFLFTGSLLHRRLLVEPQAFNLQLRETARGEVELTSSAVRLALTGSRGLAITILWQAAIREQQLHKWNEVELLVNSITKLQPYFVTPWRFQSWNMAFNVSVECDQPRDKYYYVSRGLELLAEGERRNRGSGDELRLSEESGDGQPARFPGNPDMRHDLGFTYQLKIGASDEKTTMQCLLDLSCIDPVRRDPNRLLAPTERGLEVNEEAFAKFCQQNPRLVRRLRDVLGYNQPTQIVGFLKANGAVPSRFETPTFTGAGEPPDTALKMPPKRQFPILPPKLFKDWPDPTTRDLTTEAMDVFQASQAWYSYAQLPLPPEKSDPGLDDPRYRKPRNMMLVLFRGYPSHSQRFAAEALAAEGFFDEEGWLIKDWPSWFRGPKGESRRGVRVGVEGKYHAGRSWDKTFRMYRDYGERTGQFLSPEQRQNLDKQARLFRDTFKVRPDQFGALPQEMHKGEMGRSFEAHAKLAQNQAARSLTNYDNHLYSAQTERMPTTVLARKLCFQADRLKKVEQDPTQALAAYEEAWPLWLDVLMTNPDYRRLGTVQEDICDLQIKYVRLLQDQYANDLLRPLAIGLAKFAVWPHATFDKLLSDNDRLKIIPIRLFRTPLEMLLVYDGPHAEELPRFLLGVTTGPMLACGGAFPGVLVVPSQQERLLTTSGFAPGPHYPEWKQLLPNDVVQLVRDRAGLPQMTQQPKKE